jgi:uncharacterized protein with PIN domain
MELIKANDNEFPICSFCDKELTQIKMKRIDQGLLKQTRNAYFCPHCYKILGIAEPSKYKF